MKVNARQLVYCFGNDNEYGDFGVSTLEVLDIYLYCSAIRTFRRTPNGAGGVGKRS